MLSRELKLTTVVVMLLATAGAALGQGKDDPWLESLQQAMAELGQPQDIASDPSFKRSRAQWAEHSRAIQQAEKAQDAALERNASAIKDTVLLYQSRAESRGGALDHHLFARILGLTGELDLAYEHFRRALEIDKWFFWAWDGLGVYQIRMKQWHQAVRCFDRALQINPRFIRSMYGAGQAHLRQGEYGKAAGRLEKILLHEKASESPKILKGARLILAEVYRNQKQHAQAIEQLDQVISLNDTGAIDTVIYSRRALCFRLLEKYADAARDYETILATDHADYRYNMQLATCYMQLGRNHDAANQFESGLKKAGKVVTGDERTRLEAEIARLRTLPSTQRPEKRRASLPEMLNRLARSTEVKRRREAIIWLSKAPLFVETNPKATQQINKAILNALMDRDWLVRAKAIEEVSRRMHYRDEIVTKIWGYMIKDTDSRVRGMAHRALTAWGKPMVVPYLMKGLEDRDPYVFLCAHEALNEVTLAWVHRVVPGIITPKVMAAIRADWKVWYVKNRDRYRRYELKG